MKMLFKQTRDWLNQATRDELDKVIKQALLSKTQIQILIMKRKGRSNVYIALKLHCDISTVNREINKIYQLTSKVLNYDSSFKLDSQKS